MKKLLAWWRQSIQLRVVTQTVVLGTIVVAVTSLWLVGRIADGLTENRINSAVGEAQAGFSYAQQHLDASAGADRSPSGDDLNDVIDRLIDRTGPDRRFDIILEGPLTDQVQRPVRSSSFAAREALPTDLVSSVEGSRGTLWAFTSVALDTNSVSAVAVGSQIHIPRSGDTFAMYYVFPLADIAGTLDLVQRTFALGAIGMVVLVGAVAWLMSRQILTPIRLVRQVAERYSSGHLEQRLAVLGDDDIARLGASFNEMAMNLQAHIQRLEELSRLQRQFVSDVSHELRTPLTTVSMASEMLHEQRDQFDPETKRAIELLKNQLDHYERLLVDLLEISHFDAGAAVLDDMEVDVVELVNRVIANLGQVSMSIALTSTKPAITLFGDRRRIERIIRNLLRNALAHSKGSTITITISSDDAVVTISVADDGIGIPADALPMIFGRFWRADPARSGEGTGLGLAIALEDAELHGGTLTVNSALGRGTEFVLTLPLRAIEVTR